MAIDLRRWFDVHDLLALAGFVALLYGIAQWSGPAAWVVGGVCLLALAFAPRWRRVKGEH